MRAFSAGIFAAAAGTALVALICFGSAEASARDLTVSAWGGSSQAAQATQLLCEFFSFHLSWNPSI